MIKLQSFPTLFENAQPTNGDPFDLRFEEAVSLVEQDQFDKATPLIESILEEGCLDIRLIMHLFYAHFLQEGLQSLKLAFPYLINLINEQWEKLSPIDNRESHANKSIIWFLSSIGKRLKRSAKVHKEHREDPLWSQTSSLSIEEIDQVEKHILEVKQFLTNHWKLASSEEYLQYFLKWIKDFKGSLPIDNPEPEKEEGYSSSSYPLESEKEVKDSLQGILVSSEKMKELYAKLQLFEALISERNFAKASLVSDDIKQTIETFNPIAFFPKLFSRFYALVAKHIDTLSNEWDKKGSPKWDALYQLFQTDLEAFVDW